MFTFLFIVHNNKWQKRWPVENIDEYQDITRMRFSVQKTSALKQVNKNLQDASFSSDEGCFFTVRIK